MDRTEAARIAADAAEDGVRVAGSGVRELADGWFFPFEAIEEMAGGSQGVVVNKQTRAVFHVGSAFEVERDLRLYDKGYQFELYDLVIHEVADLERTLNGLAEARLQTVTPEYQSGTVWRVSRAMTRTELKQRLARLPCVFGACHLYRCAESIEQLRTGGACRLDVLACAKPALL